MAHNAPVVFLGLVDSVARWYIEQLNPRYRSELQHQVIAATDIELRRKDTQVSHAYQDISSKLEILRFHGSIVLERIELGRACLPSMLEELAGEVVANPEQHARFVESRPVECEFYDYILTAHLEGTLVQTK